MVKEVKVCAAVGLVLSALAGCSSGKSTGDIGGIGGSSTSSGGESPSGSGGSAATRDGGSKVGAPSSGSSGSSGSGGSPAADPDAACAVCASTDLGGNDAGDGAEAEPPDAAPNGGGGDACSKITSCKGCAFVSLAVPDKAAECMGAVQSDNVPLCTEFLGYLQAAPSCR